MESTAIIPQDLAIKARETLPNLDKLLDAAPLEIEYREDRMNLGQGVNLDGFTLANEAVKMHYSEFGFGGQHTLDLWFMQTTPVVSINGRLYWAQTGETGAIEAASLDLALIFRDSRHILAKKHVQRGYTLPPIIEQGDETWFLTADALFKKAVRKYNVVGYLSTYYDLTPTQVDILFMASTE